MLKANTEGEVNEHLKSYIKWLKRQHAHEVEQTINHDLNDRNVHQDNLVRQVLIEKVKNTAMEQWATGVPKLS